MTEEKSFKQRKPVNPLDSFNPSDAEAVMEKVNNLEKQYKTTDPMQERMAAPAFLQGAVPPEVANMFKKGVSKIPKDVLGAAEKPVAVPRAENQKRDDLLARLKKDTGQYEEIVLPSLSKFYTDEAPPGGVIHVRRMTGDEEEILGTPRFLKKGQAINMIFNGCVKEQINPEKWLVVDRTYLLIYLRGISMGSSYDVELRCPGCSSKFESSIELDDLMVKYCPQEFTEKSLKGTLPISGFSFQFRMPTVGDEMVINQYSEKHKADNRADDTLTFRLATLVEEIEGLDELTALMEVIKALPIADFAYLRETINDIPFGADTKVEQSCPSCSEEFKIDLPLEASFFFPRREEGKPHPSIKLKNGLREDQWFYLYNFNMHPEDTNKIPILERRWFIERFVKQKERERDIHDREMKNIRK